MRHVIFGLILLFYLLTFSQNWTQYSIALMIAAWIKHDGRLLAAL